MRKEEQEIVVLPIEGYSLLSDNPPPNTYIDVVWGKLLDDPLGAFGSTVTAFGPSSLEFGSAIYTGNDPRTEQWYRKTTHSAINQSVTAAPHLPDSILAISRHTVKCPTPRLWRLPPLSLCEVPIAPPPPPDRKDVLLRAAYDLIKRSSMNHFVEETGSIYIHYDEADCDGLCLMSDIMDELGLEEGTKPIKLVEKRSLRGNG